MTGGVGSAVRVAWALGTIPPIATPTLCDRLAGALSHVARPPARVALQIGFVRAGGQWRLEAYGTSGLAVDGRRLGRAMRGLSLLPWVREVAPPDGDSPVVHVAEPSPRDGRLWPIVGVFEDSGGPPELAGVVWGGCLVVTVQVAMDGGGGAARTPLLGQVLPWVWSIAREAIGEASEPGEVPWLSSREASVLEGLVLGKSVAEIAADLSRSPHTVHDHAKALHRKLGVRSRAELVARAIRGVRPPGV